MKPDPDYINKLLHAFQASPEPTTDIQELERAGLSYEAPEFFFHMQLLNDQAFVERADGKHGLGCEHMLGGHYSWSVLPLRLTAAGHEFAEALNRPAAMAAVKKAGTTVLSLMYKIAVDISTTEIKRHIGLL